VIPVILPVLIPTANAQAEQAEKVASDAQEMSQGVDALVALLRDKGLANDYAPEDWKQPDLAAYEVEGAPPSQLPIESIERAVAEGRCAQEVLDGYREWKAAQEDPAVPLPEEAHETE